MTTENASSNKSERGVSLEQVLEKFHIFGRYHSVQLLLLMFGFMLSAWYSTNYVFTVADSGYKCKHNLSSHSVREMINSEQTNVDRCFQPSSDLAGVVPCQEWEYEDPYSFVAEFQLACQDWKRTLVGTAHSFGYMLGLLALGPFADRFGRKITIIITGLMGAIVGIAKSFCTSYWLFIFLEILEPTLGDTCSSIYMTAVEMVPKEHRVLYSMLLGFPSGLGGITSAIIAWRFTYWRHYVIVLYAPALLSILYVLWLDESPRWLLSKGKKEEALKIIRKAAKQNKLKDDDNLELKTEDESQHVSFKESLRTTLASRTLVLRFLLCITMWTTCSFVSYGLYINSVHLPGNKYVNFALTSLAKWPSSILGFFLLKHFKRKTPLAFSFLASGLFCVAQAFVPAGYPWLSIGLFASGEMMVHLSFISVYLFTSELFPTYTRNTMHALCSAIGRVGSIVSPQTPLLAQYWSGLPTLLFGGAALAAALATLLMPDAADGVLPDTVRQAEAVGARPAQCPRPTDETRF